MHWERLGIHEPWSRWVAALEDWDWKVRETAVEALQRVLEHAAAHIALDDLRAIACLSYVLTIEYKTDNCGNSTVYGTGVNCSQVKQLARQELIRRELGAVAVEALVAALKGKDRDVRKTAAEDLRNLGNTHVVEALVAALEHWDLFVQEAAAEALGRIGDARAVEPLRKALRNRGVRWAAEQALKEIQSARGDRE